ncbi:SAM-dependent methyltransferase [Olivibacter sp. CPCC 100613]|uniref:class I SAM-dependent methyltransferase n=1 Tax=Olivibacter sp. CPCC 100613 TaxID=3079931 RepID=UPI002FFA4F9C
MLRSTEDFELLFTESLKQLRFVKLTLGHYQGKEDQLKQIHVREIHLKGGIKLTFTYRYQTRDIVKNLTREAGIELIKSYLRDGFKAATLFTLDHNIVWTQRKNGTITLRKEKATIKEVPNLSHDKQKNRLIQAHVEKHYLQALGILDRSGVVYKSAQDKFKQINHYIGLLRPLIQEIDAKNLHKVVDMGSGKGYLTFALYDYLYHVLGLEGVEVTGVEFREDLVSLCNQIALQSGFTQLKFRQGTIVDYQEESIDLLVALHACDTATDDAIYRGISAAAKLIVVAPCCHKQIRRQLEGGKIAPEIQPITRFGIFLERQAEMLTDTLRALIMEYYGYKIKVLEFISDAHTPKNILIVASKLTSISVERREQILQQIKQTKTFFGVKKHHLEHLLQLDV